jgi:Uma2 family endonuclease
VKQDPHVSPEEYLEIDQHSEVKHEYMFGEMVRVPGGSPRHSLITANTCIALGRRVNSSRFRIFDSSLRVCLNRDASFYVYPDLTVVEGAIECLDETVTNPKVVIEVFSPATRDVGLGGKARMYLGVPSLTDLLMIDQDRVAVEHWVRESTDRWDVTMWKARDAVIPLESLGFTIPVDEVYAGVQLMSLV